MRLQRYKDSEMDAENDYSRRRAIEFVLLEKDLSSPRAQLLTGRRLDLERAMSQAGLPGRTTESKRFLMCAVQQHAEADATRMFC